jgi:hypothetical protein
MFKPAPFGHQADMRIGIPRLLALLVGVVYTVVGVAGFLLTGWNGGDVFDPAGEELLGFRVNPAHNVIHLIAGVGGLLAARRVELLRLYGWLLALAFGGVFVYGWIFAAYRNTEANPLALDAADNWLHLGTTIVGLLIALWRAPRIRSAAEGGAAEFPVEGR